MSETLKTYSTFAGICLIFFVFRLLKGLDFQVPSKRTSDMRKICNPPRMRGCSCHTPRLFESMLTFVAPCLEILHVCAICKMYSRMSTTTTQNSACREAVSIRSFARMIFHENPRAFAIQLAKLLGRACDSVNTRTCALRPDVRIVTWEHAFVTHVKSGGSKHVGTVAGLLQRETKRPNRTVAPSKLTHG
jgi:hypothetical protein